jgi:hypothetical protein
MLLARLTGSLALESDGRDIALFDNAAAVGDGELLRALDDDWVFELRRTHAERVRGADRAAAAIAAPAAVDKLARLRAA